MAFGPSQVPLLIPSDTHGDYHICGSRPALSNALDIDRPTQGLVSRSLVPRIVAPRSEHGRSMASLGTMPDDILRRLLDYLCFADRLRVLAVNSRCRAVGKDHPFYWKRLHVDMDTVRETVLQGAIDHLLARLTHAGQRPVEISLKWSDPRRVADRILSHISHIVFLELSGVDMRIGQAVLDALNRSEAPILHELILNFNGALDAVSMMEPRPCLGSDLFQSKAPSLERMKLINIDFPAGFPNALGRLTSLQTNVSRGPIQELPFFLEHCRHLSLLTLSGRISFSPESHNAHKWRQLRMLMITSSITQNESYPWHAWARIPSLIAGFVSVGAATAALEHLSGPLRLLFDIDVHRGKQIKRFECYRLSVTTNDHDSDDFGLSAAGTHFWRLLTGPMPPAAPPDMQYSGGLLAIAACAARFVRLTLPLAHWARFAAYVPRLPALQQLRLVLGAGARPQFARHKAPLECPALARVRLAPESARRAVAGVNLNEFAVFFAAAVRGVANPVDLTCEKGVGAARVPCDENFKRVFRSAECTKVSREGLVVVRLE